MANLLKLVDIKDIFKISPYMVEKFVSSGKLEEIRFGQYGHKYYRLSDCLKLWGNPQPDSK